ncbi:hypothetical protein CCR83_09645 [Rhodobacter veldkampii DSM 11550]|uniref:Uncharacterized protein n=1 Tax=Phaeovulum veldkampii DSM 11550 TaxID=1185920 RepID=A0A2T4JMR0_9RHOB|nr:hypothetical protein [Phaeovulum veldkampii]MBK5946690.1 hypothetical protein [Phaeovulum veldkampii DSM 11550]PTE19143.1 hypothetical protein C5F46_01565 [Phaeovulum veldkampii DSM 11550]TDQ61295.1 hypothetical protein EV658_1049 [Phaeovulum veldkampii DSM 11550]
MEMLIWAGAAVSAAGVLAIGWCILAVLRLRRANLPDAEARARLARVVAMNLAALFVSVIGLMMVVVGIILG